MKTFDMCRKQMFAFMMMLVTVFSLFAPIAQQVGLFGGDALVTTAFAEETTGSSGGIGDVTVNADGTLTFGNAANVDVGTVIGRGKTIVSYILAVCFLVALGSLILNIAKYAKSGDNESENRKAIKGILTSLIGAALLGSVTFWFSFATGAISGMS